MPVDITNDNSKGLRSWAGDFGFGADHLDYSPRSDRSEK
jgi:hypothetical protein